MTMESAVRAAHSAPGAAASALASLLFLTSALSAAPALWVPLAAISYKVITVTDLRLDRSLLILVKTRLSWGYAAQAGPG